MTLSPSSQFMRSPAIQGTPCMLWNPEVHYRIHNSPPLVPILGHINSVHASHHTSWGPILILSSHLRLGLPSKTWGFSHQNPVWTSPLPIRGTCTVHLILLGIPGINYFIPLTTNFLRFGFDRSKKKKTGAKCCQMLGRPRNTSGVRPKTSLPGASEDMELVPHSVRHPCLMLPSIQTHETVITILTSQTVCHLVISCSS